MESNGLNTGQYFKIIEIKFFSGAHPGLGGEDACGLVIFMGVDGPVGEDDVGLGLFDEGSHLVDPLIVNYGCAVYLSEEVRLNG